MEIPMEIPIEIPMEIPIKPKNTKITKNLSG